MWLPNLKMQCLKTLHLQHCLTQTIFYAYFILKPFAVLPQNFSFSTFSHILKYSYIYNYTLAPIYFPSTLSPTISNLIFSPLHLMISALASAS